MPTKSSGSPAKPTPSPVMDEKKIARTLARLALEIVEKNRGTSDLVLVGIRTRGVPIAKRLAKTIAAHEKHAVPVGAIDITLYRDDLSSIHEAPMVRASDIPFEVDGKVVVLVDDVLFTGRTIRAAIDTVLDYGRPRAIRLAALVDRGHRELPIQADYVGKLISTKTTEQIDVHLSEIDGEDAVFVGEKGTPPPKPETRTGRKK